MTEPIFKRPELEDKEIITSYFHKSPSRSCERTFVNVYLWSRHYKVKYAVIEDALVFRSDDDGLSFSYPAGDPENVRRAVDYLAGYCKEKECPLVFYNVTPEMFAQLETVIQDMEKGDVSLEDSFELYNRGMTLLKKCNKAIDEVEKKVLVLDENGETHEF